MGVFFSERYPSKHLLFVLGLGEGKYFLLAR